MRAWPEQTQLEDLSVASFLGKLLELPAYVRLDWKVFARDKHYSLFGLIVSNEEKSFIILTPGVNNYLKKRFASSLRENKLERLSVATISCG